MPVMSLRVDEKAMRRLERLAKRQKRDRSEVARELLADGWTLSVLRRFKQGKVSLGSAASELDMSISELLDLFSEFGVSAPLSYDAYLEGLETLEARRHPDRGNPR